MKTPIAPRKHRHHDEGHSDAADVRRYHRAGPGTRPSRRRRGRRPSAGCRSPRRGSRRAAARAARSGRSRAACGRSATSPRTRETAGAHEREREQQSPTPTPGRCRAPVAPRVIPPGWCLRPPRLSSGLRAGDPEEPRLGEQVVDEQPAATSGGRWRGSRALDEREDRAHEPDLRNRAVAEHAPGVALAKANQVRREEGDHPHPDQREQDRARQDRRTFMTSNTTAVAFTAEIMLAAAGFEAS